ncbi:hypothetical protein KTQ74_00765 [Pseudomonas chlororaphis]|uniref:hypothetical protein n=1 Tax=Pseudomonas chlororaphis TaxID=587753 RepID=UPI001E46A15C|nr:hypothetical protein [Pseudomonas chlororaphis]MCB2250406.1 hypothetical protein [Pseudomonas chlororaphis]
MSESRAAKLLKANYALWGLIGFILFTVVPTLLKFDGAWLNVLQGFGTSLLAAMSITFFVDKRISASKELEVSELIEKHIPRLLEFERLGLEKIVYGNNMEVVGIDLVSEPNLYIVMNDGKNFFTNNAKKLAERFKKENRKTIVILLSDTSSSEDILNKRNGKEGAGYYGRKIQECIKDYQGFYKDAPESNELSIYKFGYNFTMSIVATDSKAVIGMYRNAAGKSLAPPHFVFSKEAAEGEYSNVMKDVRNLMESSEKVGCALCTS